MKIRMLSIACVTAAVALLAACTATFRNSDACEQLMRGKLADTSSDTLKVDHRGAGIHGSRVVIEGSIEHVTTASETMATAASSARVAAASAHGASAARASGVGAASDPAVSADAASASDASGASEAKNLTAKLAKPTTVVTAAAAECTFNGPDLNVFRWLAPAKLATPADEAANATAG